MSSGGARGCQDRSHQGTARNDCGLSSVVSIPVDKFESGTSLRVSVKTADSRAPLRPDFDKLSRVYLSCEIAALVNEPLGAASGPVA